MSGLSSNASPQRRLIVVGLGGGLIFLVLVCVSLGVVMATRSRTGPAAGQVTPTPAPATGVPPLISGPGGSVPLTLTAPSLIEFKNRKFEVVPIEVTRGQWPFQHGTPGKATWVFGTLVNYVIGLEANADNTALLQALTEGDLIKMTTYGGKSFSFRYSGRQWVAVDQTDVFRQLRPGLTLVLLGEKGDQRLVVSTSYLADSTPPSSGGTLADPGTAVEVAGARVTAIEGKLLREAAGLPPGNAYYLVDFTVTGSGTSALDASLFQMQLIDESGKRYSMSIPASQAGRYGPPGGQLLPRTSLTATAGFIVPDTLPGSYVFWTFSPQAGGPAPARFQLSIAGSTPAPDARALVTVQLTQARYSSDGKQVLISGGIGNPSKEAVTVSLSDINLQTGSSLVPVQSTDPPLPWVLQPGQNLAFVIQFARPPAGTAIFRMMQSAFELSGLQ